MMSMQQHLGPEESDDIPRVLSIVLLSPQVPAVIASRAIFYLAEVSVESSMWRFPG